MASPIGGILKKFTRAFHTFAETTATMLIFRLHEDGNSDDVEDAVDAVWQSLMATSVIADATKEAMRAAYAKAKGATIPLFPSDLSKAWDESGMTLSQKLHGSDKEMRAAIVKTIKGQLEQNQHAIHAARALYDGYNSGVAVTNQQSLPKYLQDVVDFSRRANLTKEDAQDLQRKVRKAKTQIAKLAQNGAPNKALKTAYAELIAAVEEKSEKALDRSVHTAIEEKSRYVAERITRTEAARAWADGFIERYADDDMVVAFRWKLSSRHPTYDICDMYANADLYGLGKGIFPKDKTPNLPVHPHCLCHLAPVFESELKKIPHNLVKRGGEKYIDGLTLGQKQKLLGVAGYEKYEMGQDWRSMARNYSPEVLKSAAKNGTIKAEGALNDKNDPDMSCRIAHAERYYMTMRKSNAQIIIGKLAKNGGISEVAARKVYQHVFIDNHSLADGVHPFYPSYDMAQSFQRLLEGKNIHEHDLILLRHEHLERELMHRYGKDYETAHLLTEQKYNFRVALDKWKKRGEK